MQPDVCIGILNWNSKNTTSGCIDSIRDVTEYPNYQLLVLDNGSNDGSVDAFLEWYPEIDVISNDTNRGVARGYNQILDWAANRDFEYVVLLNNDTRAKDPYWLTKFIDGMESDGTIGVIGCKNVDEKGNVSNGKQYLPLPMHMTVVRLFGIHNLIDYSYNRYEDLENETGVEYVDIVVGSAFIVRTRVYEEIGGFDEIYSPIYWGDYDYCLKVWNGGFKVGYHPQIAMTHFAQDSDMDSIMRNVYLYRNSLRFIIINYPIMWVAFAIPSSTINTGNMLIRNAWKFVKNPFKIVSALSLTFLTNFLVLHKLIQKRLERRKVTEMLK